MVEKIEHFCPRRYHTGISRIQVSGRAGELEDSRMGNARSFQIKHLQVSVLSYAVRKSLLPEYTIERICVRSSWSSPEITTRHSWEESNVKQEGTGYLSEGTDVSTPQHQHKGMLAIWMDRGTYLGGWGSEVSVYSLSLNPPQINEWMSGCQV